MKMKLNLLDKKYNNLRGEFGERIIEQTLNLQRVMRNISFLIEDLNRSIKKRKNYPREETFYFENLKEAKFFESHEEYLSYMTNKNLLFISEFDYLSLEHLNFLREHVKSIDFFSIEENNCLSIYELKTLTNKNNKKKDLTENTQNCYILANELDIKTYSIFLYFNENYDIEIVKKKFDLNDFKINNGGYYRK